MFGVTFAFGLGGFAAAQDTGDDSFSMRIMEVFTITGRGTVLTGQVLSGSVTVGENVCIPLLDGETAPRIVEGIELMRKQLDRAEKGQIVGVLLQVDKKKVEKGGLLHSNCEPVEEAATNPGAR